MRRGLSWFEIGLALFAGALPVGVVLMIVAPVDFFHAAGLAILAMALLGLWMSAIGLRLERPDRWAEIRASFGRFAGSSPTRHRAR